MQTRSRATLFTVLTSLALSTCAALFAGSAHADNPYPHTQFRDLLGVQIEAQADASANVASGLCLDPSASPVRVATCDSVQHSGWDLLFSGASDGTRPVAFLTVATGPGSSKCAIAQADGTLQLRACSGAATRWYVGTGTGGAALTLMDDGTHRSLDLPKQAGDVARESAGGSAQWYVGAPSSTSHYIRNLHNYDASLDTLTAQQQADEDYAAMKDAGCADAAAARQSRGPQVTVLHIGAQSIRGGLSVDSPGVALSGLDPAVRLTYDGLVHALTGYIGGYLGCQGSGPKVTIGVATNNDGDWNGDYKATARGIDWARKVVDPLAAAAASLDPSASHLTVAGAFDVEGGFASSVGQALEFIRSYVATKTSAPLIFTGSADGCPTDHSGTDVPCQFGSDGWTQDVYRQLAYGAAPGHVLALPQIYNVEQALQWTRIDELDRSHPIQFIGTLTEYAACAAADQTCVSLTPRQAVTAFRAALADNGFWTGPLASTTDLRADYGAASPDDV